MIEGTSIIDHEVLDWIFEEESPEFSVEFYIDSVADLQKFAERESDNTTRSFGIEWIPNADASTTHYIRLAGFRPATVDLTASVGTPFTATVTGPFETFDTTPQTTDPGIGTGSRETASSVSESVKTFAGGLIQKGGSSWATIVNNFDVTFDHQTEMEHTTGSQAPTTVTHGERMIDGSADIAYEDGFKPAYDETSGESETTINVQFGQSSGDPQWNLTGAILPSFQPEQSVGDNHVISGRPFRARSVNFTTV